MLCRILLGTNLQLNHERLTDIDCANVCKHNFCSVESKTLLDGVHLIESYCQAFGEPKSIANDNYSYYSSTSTRLQLKSTG